VKKLNANSKNTSSSINEIRKTFEELGLSTDKQNQRNNSFKKSVDTKNNRYSYIHNPEETSTGVPKIVPKMRPKSAEYSSDFQLHKISNQSGNKTEFRRIYIDPIIEEDDQLTTKIGNSPKTNLTKTPSFTKTKNNSFLKSDIFSSFNRLFKYTKPGTTNKNTDTLDLPPIRSSPPVTLHHSVRGFDSFMMYLNF